jgi:DNA-binding NarL/FixJ family response regulator
MSIRVALVDDQALFRAGIRMLVSSQADLEFVGEAGDGVEGVALAASAKPDIVLMDIRMPVMDGIESTRLLLEAAAARGGKQPRVIVLTTFDLDEDADPEFLLAAIRTVHAGTAVIAAAQTRELFEHFDSRAGGGEAPGFEELTSREKEIFGLAAQGLSNAEIAKKEFLSEATVKTHISRVLAKLELRDRVQLVVYAYENGLVES